jgi:hypothetical protein
MYLSARYSSDLSQWCQWYADTFMYGMIDAVIADKLTCMRGTIGAPPIKLIVQHTWIIWFPNTPQGSPHVKYRQTGTFIVAERLCWCPHCHDYTAMNGTHHSASQHENVSPTRNCVAAQRADTKSWCTTSGSLVHTSVGDRRAMRAAPEIWMGHQHSWPRVWCIASPSMN